MSFKFRLPHYFGHSIRREMNELYMATAIADLALGLILVFEPGFFYSKLGFCGAGVRLFFAAVFGYIMEERAREGQIGREFSVASSIISLTQAIGPFIGALIAVRFG